MTAPLRKALAWLRARWHADLEFQHGVQRRAFEERLGVLLAGVLEQTQRADQLDGRLSDLGACGSAISAGMANEHAERLRKLEGTTAAVALEMSARIQATATEVRGAIHTAGEQASRGIAALFTEFAAVQTERDVSLQERLARVESLLADLCGAAGRDASAAHETARMMAEIAQQVRDMHAWNLAKEAREETARRLEQDACEDCMRRAAANASGLLGADREAIERQGVFVVGCARSGTTILSDCLNVSRDVYMLQEGFFFNSAREASLVGEEHFDFAKVFNERHVQYRNQRAKGTYVPTAETPDRTPLELLNRFRSRYRYVGEKLAFGPAPHRFSEQWEDDFLTYQARHFYHSQYFITVRAPHETIWSMHKMFPDREFAQLFEAWLRALRTALDLYIALPNTQIFLLEWLDEGLVRRIAETLQIEIPLPRRMLGRFAQQSSLADGELIPPLRPYAEWCERCWALYAELRSALSPETMQFVEGSLQRDRVAEFRERASSLLDEVLHAWLPEDFDELEAA